MVRRGFLIALVLVTAFAANLQSANVVNVAPVAGAQTCTTRTFPGVTVTRQRPFITGVFTQNQFLSGNGTPFKNNSGGPLLAASGLLAGDSVFVQVTGTMYVFSDNSFPFGTNGAGNANLLFELVGQWTNDANQVIGDGFDIDNASTRIVPSGATRLYVAFTDSDYFDNHGSYLVETRATTCSNAQCIPNIPPTRTFTREGLDAVLFFFIEKGIKPYVDGVAIDNDPATTQKICELAGYSQVLSLNSRNFASCGDNFVEYWDGANFIRSAACSRQPYIDTLVCGNPIQCQPATQCADGLDNDGDGAIDLADFSCTNSADNDETNPKAACQDGTDNDGDGLTDFPNDPGCISRQDNDEFNPPLNNCTAQDPRIACVRNQLGLPAIMSFGASLVGNSQIVYWDQTISKSQLTAAVASCGLQLLSQSNYNDTALKNLVKGVVGQPTSNNSAYRKVIIAGLCNQSVIQSYRTAGHQISKDDDCNDPELGFDINRIIQPGDTMLAGHPVTPGELIEGVSDAGDNGMRAALLCIPSAAPGSIQCSDGLDNDGDGATDLNDFSCANSSDNDETNPKAQCQDGIDNDGDGLIDFPNDPGCTSKQDNDEGPLNSMNNATCGVSLFPSTVTAGQQFTASFTINNTGTSSWTQPNYNLYDVGSLIGRWGPNGAFLPFSPVNPNSAVTFSLVLTAPTTTGTYPFLWKMGQNGVEFFGQTCGSTALVVQPAANPQCSNGADDDTDGATDFPNDFSCTDGNDNDETNIKSQCQDGLDNDGDTLIDFPNDSGCASRQDNDESNTTSANLSITKTGSATVKRGGQLSYTITVTNLGPSSASNVITSDPIPAGLSIIDIRSVSTPNCSSGLTSTISCTEASLAAGASVSYTIIYDVPGVPNCSATTFQNQASVQSAVNDPVQSNNTSAIVSTSVQCQECADGIDNDNDGATDYTNDFSCTSQSDTDETNPKAQCQDGLDNDGDGMIDFGNDPGCASKQDDDERNAPIADLAIVKSAPTSVIRGTGSQLVYTVTTFNLSQTSATGVTISDLIPAGLTGSNFVSALSPGCSLSGSTLILCNNFTLAGNSIRSFRIVFNVPNVANCTQLSLQNTATVRSSATDPVISNNQSSTVTTSVLCQTGAQCGNGQDDDGDGATDFPNDFSCTDANDNDETNAKAQCQDGLDNDGDTLIDFPNDPGCVSRQDNDEGTTGATDLAIVKQGPAIATRGNVISYNVTVFNLGTATGTSIVVSDAPSGIPVTNFVSAQSTAGCAINGAQTAVTCTAFNLAPASSKTFTLAFTIPTVQNCSGTLSIQNQATLTSTNSDPNTSNNTSNSVATSASCQPAQNQCANGADDDNDGAIDLNDFSCADANDNDEANPKSQCQDGIDNDGDGLKDFQGDPGCVSIQDNDETNVGGNADLSVTFSGPSQVVRGNNVTYTAVVTNAGPATATNVTLTDPPLGFTLVPGQSTNGCTQNGAVVTCTLASLASGNSQTFTLVFSTSSSTCNISVTDTAIVSSSNPDPNVANNISQTVATFVTCNGTTQNQCSDGVDNDGDGATDFPNDFSCTDANDNDETNSRSQCQDGIDNDNDGRTDLNDPDCSSRQDNSENGSGSTAKCDDDDLDVTIIPVDPTVEAGEEAEFEITIENDSNDDCQVTLRAELDDDLHFLFASSGGDDDSRDLVIWRDLIIREDDERTVRLEVRVDRDADEGDTLEVEASIPGSDDTAEIEVVDDNSGGSTSSRRSSSSAGATTDARLSVSKAADRSTAQPNDVVAYTLTIRNSGTRAATNVTVQDTFNAGQLSIIDPAGGTVSGSGIRWTLDRIDGNTTRTLRYTARISNSMRHGDVVQNNVSVSGGITATNDSNLIRIIQQLPQTGLGISRLSKGDARLSPSVRTSDASKSGMDIMALLAWMSTLGGGVGVGSLVGKKLFI